MENILDMLMCPNCKCELDKNLVCSICKNKYNFERGVFNIVDKKLSSNQEILWGITDDMIDNDIELEAQKAKRKKMIEEYNSYMNKETIEAQELQDKYMDNLIEGFSGVVCDLSTGMGRMLQRLLNSSNENFSIVCTDIDKRILILTKKFKGTDDNRVTYVATDGRYLSIKDESFDFITSLAALGNIPENNKVVKELYRVLKPNGKIVIEGNYIEKGTKSFDLAKSKGIERGLVEEYLIEDLKNAGFVNIKSNIVSEAIWAENPYDLIPATGDNQLFCVIEAQRPL